MRYMNIVALVACVLVASCKKEEQASSNMMIAPASQGPMQAEGSPKGWDTAQVAELYKSEQGAKQRFRCQVAHESAMGMRSPAAVDLPGIEAKKISEGEMEIEATTQDVARQLIEGSFVRDIRAGDRVRVQCVPAVDKVDATAGAGNHRELADGLDLIGYYYAVSNEQPDYKKIGRENGFLSSGGDAFAEQDELAQFEKLVQEKIAGAKANPFVSVIFRERIGPIDTSTFSYQFDFLSDKTIVALPLTVDFNGRSTQSNDTAGFKVGFTNADDVRSVRLADGARAREVEKALAANSRQTAVQVFGKVVAASPYPSDRRVLIQPTRVLVCDGEDCESPLIDTAK